MTNRSFEFFNIELKEAFNILQELHMSLTRFVEILEVKPLSKDDIMNWSCTIRENLKGAKIIFEIILNRIEKYGPKDKYLYDTINNFYNKTYDMYSAFVDASYTYEKDNIRGSDIFYKISLESLRAVKEMIDLIAHELNL